MINQENQGAGIARNNGMVHAKGEYLLFLDADDYFNPKLCGLHVLCLNELPAFGIKHL